jgi:phage-related protein
LEFDEKENIKYSAKITGKTTLSYIPFGEGDETIYKGEGTIVFTCYNPFGRKERVENSFAQVLPTGSGYTVGIENNGDLETRPIFTVSSKGINSVLEIRRENEDGELLMKLKNPAPNSTSANGEKIFIDCKKFLIYDSSGNIYNDKIIEGDFFSIPAGVE